MCDAALCSSNHRVYALVTVDIPMKHRKEMSLYDQIQAAKKKLSPAESGSGFVYTRIFPFLDRWHFDAVNEDGCPYTWLCHARDWAGGFRKDMGEAKKVPMAAALVVLLGYAAYRWWKLE